MPRTTCSPTMQAAKAAQGLVCALIFIALVLAFHVEVSLAAVTDISATRKNGQVFLTWSETSASSYDIYRSSQPITNVGSLNPIYTTAKGSAVVPRLTEYSPAFKGGAQLSMGPISRVCLEDFSQVSSGTGVFVRDCDTSGDFYYAVLEGGNQSVVPGDNATTTAVSEAVGLPHMVQISTLGGGIARAYMYFMDTATWDSDDGHFAYIQQVVLPEGFNASQTYPLWVSGHGWGTGGSQWSIQSGNGALYGWQCVRIYVDDFRDTWFFGNKNLAGNKVGNYTEARTIQGIKALVGHPDVFIDEDRVYFKGQSMGGSGAISMGMRYPNIFAACFGSKGLTKYDPAQWGSNNWANALRPLLGDPSDNLPLKIVGRWADHLKKYEGMSVYEWQDHQRQIVERRGDEMAYLVTTHGNDDSVIPWSSQAVPWYPNATTSGHGFAGYTNSSSHSGGLWTGSPNFAYKEYGPTYSAWDKFGFRKDISFPGIIGGDNMNHNILWGCSWLSVAGVNYIDDQRDRWSIVLASDSGTQSIGLIPRRVQRFEIVPGERYRWRVTDLDEEVTYQSGIITADADRILQIPDGAITVTPQGRRVTILPASVPVALSGFSAIWTNDVAHLSWNLIDGFGTEQLYVHRQVDGGLRQQLSSDPVALGQSEFIDVATPVGGDVDYWLENRGTEGSLWFGPARLSGAPATTQLSMAQPWPNPSRGASTISYRLPVDGRVQLAIYDVRGRRVALLIDGDQPAGNHVAHWDGRTASGVAVSPGVYFAQVKTSLGKQSRKIQVLR